MQILRTKPNLGLFQSIFIKQCKQLIRSDQNVSLGKRFFSGSIPLKSTNKLDEPIKYSTSKAKTWDPINSFMSKQTRTQPASQPFIVVLCTMIFFIYFALIREENEIDVMLRKPLEETIPNIKEMTLRHQILQYEQMGLDTRSLKAALTKELELKKLNAK